MVDTKAEKTAAPRKRRGKRRPLAKIRHDLRTPINHIIGYSEMLLEEAADQVPESFLNDLQKIRAGGARLLELINQHLSTEAFPSKRPDQHQLCHELRTPVNHIIGYTELLSEQCPELGRTHFQPDLEKIKVAAATWLKLIEEHLMGGAAHEAVPKPRPAFAETALFRRMDKELHQTPVRSTLPATPQRGRLLLADDDAPNRDLLCRRLKKLGYEVVAVQNGRDALKLVRKQSFDLVLLDLLMPGLDGREVLARMKADPNLKDVPVIMISALDQVEGIVRCIELGAEDYIAKPFNPVFLRARIGAGLEKKRLRDREVSYVRQIQEEKQRSEKLLHIILPQDVAEELKATDSVKPQRFENAGVLFCDIVGFTAYCDQHAPEEVLPQLQAVVEAFEELTARYGLEKMKTIGDSFMGTIGLGAPVENPALNCVQCGQAMIKAARRLPPYWKVRVGVHVGPVIAGVVGRRKYQYDVWGDTVNLAARMEAAAQPGSICVTASTWRLLEGHCRGKPLGFLEIKGKGALELYRVQAV
jgi:class 3 adenylate cyclase